LDTDDTTSLMTMTSQCCHGFTVQSQRREGRKSFSD